jgi:N-methylhydantoinase A
MSRLITIDNGGTLTDVCVTDGQQVAYTKTLTTPHDLSRCLFDGLERVSREVSEAGKLPALLQGTDYIRYSTTQGTNALLQRLGPKLGLLVDDATVIEALAGQDDGGDLYASLVGSRSAVLDLMVDDEALSNELVTVCNQLAAEGASRFVISIGGSPGAASERRIRDLLLGSSLASCLVRCRCCSATSLSAATATTCDGPGPAC